MSAPETSPVKPETKKRRPIVIAGLIVIAALLIVAAPAGFLLATGNRVLPGIKANGIALGGLTRDAALTRLNAEIVIFENKGANFTDGKRTAHLEPLAVSPSDPDASFDIYSLDADAAADAALAVGRRGDAWQRLSEAAEALINGWSVAVPSTLDDDRLEVALRKIWSGDEKTVVDSRFDIKMEGDQFVGASATADQGGFRFDYSRAVSDFKDRLANFDKTPILLQAAKTEPTVTAEQAKQAAALLPAALKLAPIQLTADEKRWTLNATDLAAMLEPRMGDNGQPAIGLNDEAAKAYFRKLAEGYDIPASDTRFEIDPETKKLTEFKPGRDGRRIDVAKTVAGLGQALAKELAGEDGRTGFNLVAVAAKSQAITQSAADLGIKEVIGIGRSDFSGSSANRIKNIKHGSAKLNGQLIAPGAEFSALGVLEPVTLEDGYFQEQIILGDKIQTDVGGGLCQLGTTLFRAAMNTGLPITERQNHSLVVHYYFDPLNGNPGTDATLFGPHPDLRFKNDTGHWILITTEVDVPHHALTYTFWGTPDGRHGSYSPPQVIRWTAPPADTQTVVDSALKSGEQKCQNAFKGADTVFTYTVANADGTVTERKFSSHYRALPKICTVSPDSPAANGLPAAGAEAVPGNNINAPAVLPPEAAAGN